MSECSVIILDDQPASVEVHQKILVDIGANIQIVSDLSDLALAINKTKDLILFLDQHIADVFDLRDLGLPNARTDNCENVGLAIIRGWLPKLKRRDIHPALLTGFKLSDHAEEQLKRSKAQGTDVGYIHKDNIVDFEQFVRERAGRLFKEKWGRDILIAERVVREWSAGDTVLTARAFGYDGEIHDWNKTLHDIAEQSTVDIRDRVKMILYIKESLLRIFGRNCPETETGWLREEDSSMGNAMSPYDKIFSGHQHNLAAVAGLMKRIVD